MAQYYDEEDVKHVEEVEDDERSVGTPFRGVGSKGGHWKQSLSFPDDDGDAQTICTVEKRGHFTGLHAFCNLPFGENDPAWNEVRNYLENHDEREEVLDPQGEDQDTALHLICCRHPPVDVIEACVEIAPEACMCPNLHGIIPIHYASLSDEKTAPNMSRVLKVLIAAGPNSIHVTDHEGKSPLDVMLEHSAILNTNIVSLLATQRSVNSVDMDGRSPFHILGHRARNTPFGSETNGLEDDESTVMTMLTKNEEEKMGLRGGLAYDRHRRNMQECLDVLLGVQADTTSAYFDAVSFYPSWLHGHAVLNADSHRIMNKTMMVSFLPSAILLLDAYFIAAVIYAYRYATFAVITGDGMFGAWDSIVLITGSVYFGIRQIIYMTNMSNSGRLRTWVGDPWNWVDVACIVSIVFSIISIAGLIFVGEDFRVLASVTTFILWLKVASVLQSIMIDFSTFVTGIYQVGMRLPSFFLSLGILWVAFAQMFSTLYYMSSSCFPEQNSVFCTVSGSYIGIFSIISGKQTPGEITGVSFWFYVAFGVVLIMLLFNVLVSVVSAVNHIKFKGKEIFWSNRFYFLSTVSKISCNDSDQKPMPRAGDYGKTSSDDYSPSQNGSLSSRLAHIWNELMLLFNNQSIVAWMAAIIGAVGVSVLFVLGLATFGALWPPQLKKFLFCGMDVRRREEVTHSGLQTSAEQNLILNNQAEIRETLRELKAILERK